MLCARGGDDGDGDVDDDVVGVVFVELSLSVCLCMSVCLFQWRQTPFYACTASELRSLSIPPPSSRGRLRITNKAKGEKITGRLKLANAKSQAVPVISY